MSETPEPMPVKRTAQPGSDGSEAAPVRLDDPVETATDPTAPYAAEPNSAAKARGWAPVRGSGKTTALYIVILIAGVLLAFYAWGLPPFGSKKQVTDNAYVRGQTTVISPQVSGYVTRVFVQDFQQVRPGDPLAAIDDRIYRQRVQQAQANVQAQSASLDNSQQSQRSSQASVLGQNAAVESARAQLARAQADMRRVAELVAERSLSLREHDQTVATLRQAQAAVHQAEAQRAIAQEQVRTVTVGRGGLAAGVANANAALELARIDLANSIIRAPQAGQVGEVGVRLGQYVTAGTQLLFLVPQKVWVVANFKEAQTANIQPGQSATVRVDALGGAELKGKVEQLSPAAGSEFAVIRADNATGNFVKVAQRIAVRIAIDPGQAQAKRLRPGMSVEARVDTTGAGR